jgi:redox-sensing transcriptional repressor
MCGGKQLSRASVVRLELYLEVLEQLQREGRTYVTSSEIGEVLEIDPVKVRQDLFRMGSDGRPKVGYDVSHLVRLIRHEFDLDRVKPACIIGFGNLGRALAGSNIWAKAGYRLAAIFDKDPEVIGTEFGDLRVRNITELFGVVKTEGIETGVITVPTAAAQETAEMLASAGIRAIWNFAPVKLITPNTVVVEYQFLAWGLITLSYRIKSAKQKLEEG